MSITLLFSFWTRCEYLIFMARILQKRSLVARSEHFELVLEED